MMGLIYTGLLIVVTLLILVMAFWGKGSEKYPRLKTVYRDKYIDETQTLDDDLKRGKISEEVYEATKIELAHDLLAVAHPDRQLSGVTKLIVLLFAGVIVTFSAVYFWGSGYQEEAKNLDKHRASAMPYVQKWLASMSIEELQQGNTIMDLNPPLELQDNLLGTLAALNLMSSRDHHTDPKELNLLGKIYLNMDQLKLAEKSYLDLYRLDPNNNNTYYTLLNIQLAMNDYKLDGRLEALFDQFVKSNPTNESLLLYYATLLFENQKVEKSLGYFSMLADLYPKDSENYKLITQMIAGLLGQGQTPAVDRSADKGEETPAIEVGVNAMDVVIDLSGVDLTAMPQEAILFLFVRNQEVGPPLAAKRIPMAAISEFPIKVQVSERDLLMPGTTLKGQPQLSISAKISLNGDPITSSGDIEADNVIVEDLATPVSVMLNKVVE